MEIIKLWADDGSDFQPYLETYLLKGAKKPLGAVIVCPGGGYAVRAPHEAAPIAQKFNDLGYHAFVLHYRVAPYHFPDETRDVLRAVRIVRANADQWGIVKDNIAVSGFSAGGHLCLSSGTLFEDVDSTAGDQYDAASPRPDALIGCYPVVNITEPFGHGGSGKNLLGDRYEDKKFAGLFDLEKRVTKATPPAFLWSSADDQAVNVENSIRFAQAMWKLGNTAALHVFPHAHHGVGLAPDFPDILVWPELAAKFLEVSCKFARVK